MISLSLEDLAFLARGGWSTKTLTLPASTGSSINILVEADDWEYIILAGANYQRDDSGANGEQILLFRQVEGSGGSGTSPLAGISVDVSRNSIAGGGRISTNQLFPSSQFLIVPPKYRLQFVNSALNATGNATFRWMEARLQVRDQREPK